MTPKPTLDEFLRSFERGREPGMVEPSLLNSSMEDATGGEEVCVRHLNWTPCLGNHQRYDSPVRECHVSTDQHATFLMRMFHSGRITKDELTEEFSHINNYRVVLSQESTETLG